MMEGVCGIPEHSLQYREASPIPGQLPPCPRCREQEAKAQQEAARADALQRRLDRMQSMTGVALCHVEDYRGCPD